MTKYQDITLIFEAYFIDHVTIQPEFALVSFYNFYLNQINFIFRLLIKFQNLIVNINVQSLMVNVVHYNVVRIQRLSHTIERLHHHEKYIFIVVVVLVCLQWIQMVVVKVKQNRKAI
jgi:hypothetical protein